MTTVNPNLCGACSRRRADLGSGFPVTPACDAFPKGIPDEIYAGGFDHREEFPGDNGIRFDLVRGLERWLKVYEESRS